MPGRFTKRKDSNQRELVKFAKAHGFSVLETHNLGGGLDLLVGIYGIDQRVEVKDGNKPPSARLLTDGERDVFKLWRGRGPIVWESEDDVWATKLKLMAVSHGIR